MPDAPRAQRAHGFSLMEVLAAMALLAFLLLGVYGGVRTATRSVRAGTAAIERLDRVRSTQDFLRRELAQVMAQPLDRNDKGDAIFFKGDTQAMSFVAPLPGYLGHLGPQLQTLRLVDNGHGGKRLEVNFALLPPNGAPPQPFGKPEVLLEDVVRGGFTYRGRDDNGQVGPWGPDWTDGRLLPSLVRIDLVLAPGDSWPRLDAPLRVDPSANRAQFGLLRGLRRVGQ